MKFLTAILLVVGLAQGAQARTPAECHLVEELALELADVAETVNNGTHTERFYVIRAVNLIEAAGSLKDGGYAYAVGPGLAEQIYGRMQRGMSYGADYRAWLMKDCPDAA